MTDTRTRLLDAAAQVLLHDGADHFTLAAIAEHAKVSKGGLLYHFATKQQLAAALVDRLVGQFDAALKAAGSEPGAATRAYLDNTIDPAAAAAGAQQDQTTVALLAAALVDPDALEPLRAVYASWQQRLEQDGIDPAVATTVRLAVDGWWLARLMDLAPPAAGVHERTHAVLVGLIERGR